jgi:hypothetical protein
MGNFILGVYKTQKELIICASMVIIICGLTALFEWNVGILAVKKTFMESILLKLVGLLANKHTMQINS